MNLNLQAQKSIKELKKEFSSSFPFLKIEFFVRSHQEGEASPLSEELPGTATLIEVTGALREGMLTIDPKDTVAAVEKRLGDEFGLPAQIFRKQKGVWIETTATDHLTLEEQNQMGKIASATEHREPIEREMEQE